MEYFLVSPLTRTSASTVLIYKRIYIKNSKHICSSAATFQTYLRIAGANGTSCTFIVHKRFSRVGEMGSALNTIFTHTGESLVQYKSVRGFVWQEKKESEMLLTGRTDFFLHEKLYNFPLSYRHFKN